MSSGISGIDQVRKQLIKDRGTLDPRTDAALNALDELTGKSDSLIPELNSAKETLTALNATTSSILTTLEESGEDIPEYQKLLNDVKTSLGNLEDLFDDLDDETDNSSWTIAQIRSASEDLQKELNALTDDLKSLSGSLDDLDLETPVSTELKNYVSAMTSSTAQSAGKDASQQKYLEIMSTITDDMSDEEKAKIEEKAKAEAAKAGEAARCRRCSVLGSLQQRTGARRTHDRHQERFFGCHFRYAVHDQAARECHKGNVRPARRDEFPAQGP